jgi:hypothetical protein
VCRGHRRRDGAWCPACRDPSGSGRSQSPFFGRDRCAVQAGPAPVKLTGGVKSPQQLLMQAGPDARRLPIPQATPARHARATPHLGRQHLPGQPGTQHEQDAGQGGPVLDGPSPALRTRPRRRKQWGDLVPEIVGKERASHATPTQADPHGAVLLGALRPAHPAFASRDVASASSDRRTLSGRGCLP